MERSLGTLIRDGWSSLLGLVYPPFCHPCGVSLRDGRSLCDACEQALPRLKEPFCPRCGEEFPGNAPSISECPNCRRQDFAFEFARPALSFDSQLLEMIHSLKYGRRIHLADELGRLATNAFQDPRLNEARSGNWPLIPVPLHRHRERWRRFNQSEEIARSLGKAIDLPVMKALTRSRTTGTQTRLTRAERLKNLSGAFALSKSGRKMLDHLLPGAIVVDDVLTTGATAHECARVLVRAGVQKVVVVTVMRG